MMKFYTSKKLVVSIALPLFGIFMSGKTVYIEDGGVRYYWNNTKTSVEVTTPAKGNTYVGEIVIPDKISYQEKELKVAAVRSSAFAECTYLTSVSLPATVTSIGDYAFDSCEGLERIVMPGVKTIGHWSFRNCYKLKSLDFSDVLTTIGNYCFDKILEVTEVTLPATLTNIGGYAFEGNPQLQTVTCLATTPPAVKKGYLDGDEIYTIFDDSDYGDRKLYVPKGCVDAYKASLGWHHFRDNILEIQNSAIEVAGVTNGFSVIPLGEGRVTVCAPEAMTVHVVDLNGCHVRSLTLGAGEHTIEGLPAGVLIFNGLKVIVRH